MEVSMRVFQPVEPSEIESGAYVFDGKKMLITAGDGTRVNTTATAYGGVGQMWGKKIVYACVRKNRFTRELIDASKAFSINFLDNEKYRGALKYLEMVSGKDEDKIKGARLNVTYYEGVPLIEEANNVLICKALYHGVMSEEGFLDDTIPAEFYKDGDYHVIYVGELTKVLLR
jgi:flavin reductase (DIM6/NTAB) family NADH-FMN oxidoreductase RutF